ncbi:hypothetical protein JHK86_025857 [Glycine max]|nr:hypothetical protein JHK86_025857 [Glycine max]
MSLSQLLGMSNLSSAISTAWGNKPLGLQPDITQLAKIQLVQNLLQLINNNSFVNIGNNNPYLLSNPNLNPLFLNGINPLQTNKEPHVVLSGSEEYANPGLYSQAQSQCSQHDVSKSLADLDGGSIPQDYNKINSTTTSRENLAENPPLPALVAFPPKMGTFNQMDSGCNIAAQTSTESPSNTIFDDWEKLLDDETSGSYWKEILECCTNYGVVVFTMRLRLPWHPSTLPMNSGTMSASCRAPHPGPFDFFKHITAKSSQPQQTKAGQHTQTYTERQ